MTDYTPSTSLNNDNINDKFTPYFSLDEIQEGVNQEQNRLQTAAQVANVAQMPANGEVVDAQPLRKAANVEPIPFPDKPIKPSYPIEALGSILAPAAKRLAYHVQAPIEMCAQSVLAATALATQAHYNVARGNIGIGPVSLFFLTIAESGERKSRVDKLAMKPIHDFQNKRRLQNEEDQNKHDMAVEAWHIEKKAIESQYKKEPEELKGKLEQLADKKPIEPEHPNIIFSEPTLEGIWSHYKRGHPSAGLFADEGVSFFGGHGMVEDAQKRMIGGLSKLWDDGRMERTRGKNGESGVMAGRRLSAHLMVQPVVSKQVLSDPLLLGQGFLARFLIAEPESKAGTRFLGNRPIQDDPARDPDIQRYYDQLKQCIDKPIKTKHPKTKELELETLKIQGQAYQELVNQYDAIEAELKANEGKYCDIKATAGKATEHAARIAANLAIIENPESPEITTSKISNAFQIITYHLDCMKANQETAQQDKQLQDAEALLDHIRNNMGGEITCHQFNRLPNQLRNKAKYIRQLLGLLEHMEHIAIAGKNKRDMPNHWRVIHYG